MSLFKIWMMAIRPKTLTASVAPVLLGSALAAYHSAFNPIVLIITALSALFMQIGANLSNDYYDAQKGIDNEDRLGPKRVTQQGLLSAKQVKKGFIISFLIAFILGLSLVYFGGTTILLIGIVSILAAWAYTGGPFPLAYYGLGELFAFIFFGPVAVCGTFYLHTGIFNEISLMISFLPGLTAAMLMAINNLRDYKTDKVAGKYTLATLSNETIGRGIVLFFLFSSVAFTIFLYTHYQLHHAVLYGAFAFIPFIKKWKIVAINDVSAEFNLVLAACGQYLFLQSIVISLGLILS